MTTQYFDRPYTPEHDRSTNEQDRFLDYCQRNESLISVYLDSGLILQGKVVEHDRKALLLDGLRVEGKPQLISKSYIALIRAAEVLPLFLEYKGRGNYITRMKARNGKKPGTKPSKGIPKKPRSPRPPQDPIKDKRPAKAPVRPKRVVDSQAKPKSKATVEIKKKRPTLPADCRFDDGLEKGV